MSKRNIEIFKSNGWDFKFLPDPYRKIKTNLNLEISSLILFFLNKTEIHPNVITFFGIFWVYLGVSGILYQTDVSTLFGLFIFFTKLIPDYIDGALAFLKKKQSKKGHLLDVLAGNLNKLGFIIGTLIYIFYSSNDNLVLYLLFFIIILFVTDPRIYKKKSKTFFDKKINSHVEINNFKKDNPIKKILKFLYYDGRTSYSDVVILLILLDYFNNFNIILNVLPWLWATLSLLSYLQAWINFNVNLK